MAEPLWVVKFIIFWAACLICFLSFTSATNGTATFYSPPYAPSVCYGREYRGNLVPAVNKKMWGNGRACGKILRVSCMGATNLAPKVCKNTTGTKIGNAVMVEIVDYCAKCTSTINLSQHASSEIAYPDAGRIKIKY